MFSLSRECACRLAGKDRVNAASRHNRKQVSTRPTRFNLYTGQCLTCILDYVNVILLRVLQFCAPIDIPACSETPK